MRGANKASAKVLTGALAIAGVLQAAPAGAQYNPLIVDAIMYATMNMSGGGVDPCMTGTAMPAPKVAEARAATPAALQAYFRAAQAGGAKSAAFHLDKTTRWQGGGATAGSLDLDRQADPLAAPGNVLEAEPLRFYRGGTGSTALGQWAVLDARGEVAGVYTGFFARARQVWKLRELTLSQAGEVVAPAAQYCRKPGDVMEHRLSSTKTWRESAQKSVDDATQKLAQAVAGQAYADSETWRKPRDAGLALKARDAQRGVARWTKQLADREKNLAKANEKSAEAQKDADEIKRLTGEARNARTFRLAAADKPAG